MIKAPDALSAVPRGNLFHILIFDKVTGQLLGESSLWKADITASSVVNPGLKWWVLDQTVGKKVPFGWKLALSNTDLAASGFGPLGVNGTSGIRMMLNYTSTTGLVEQMALSQKMPLNSTKVDIHLDQSFVTNLSTKNLVSASLTDGTHTLYYIFSNVAIQQTMTPYTANTTIIIPTQKSQWNTITISPQSIWTNQGWAIPQLATLTVFLESSSAGVYYASFDRIAPAK